MALYLPRTAVPVLCLCAACGRTPEVAAPSIHDCSNMACRPTGTLAWTATFGTIPVDVLIVLDENVPAGQAGPTLAAAVRSMAANLQEQLDRPRYQADIHMALVPSNLDAASTVTSLWPPSQACPPVDGEYLHTSLLCGSPPNFSAPLADLLDCTSAHLPISGQPSRPLETVRALFAPGGLAQNTGFRRPQARLYLAIVTATDDPALASTAARSEYKELLSNLPAEPGGIEVVVVAPADAKDLHWLTGSLSESGAFDDIAATSWWYLSWLAEPATDCSQGFCIDFPYVDLGSRDAGPKPACNVSELATSPDGSSRERAIEACPETGTTNDVGDLPCWSPVVDRRRCPEPGMLIYIRQPASCRTPDRIEYRATCVVEYTPVEIPGDSSSPPLPCGTEDDPATLTVTKRVPALGATVRNSNITEGFFVSPPFLYLLDTANFDPANIQTSVPRHTAGYDVEGTSWRTYSDLGKTERHERTGIAWSVAPGHVELSAAVGWRTNTGCYFKLPSPLLSYDATP